jgi:hypothetical protein
VYTPGVLRSALRFLINLLTYQKKKFGHSLKERIE